MPASTLTSPSVNIPRAFTEFIACALPPHLSLDDLISACQTSLRFSIRINTLKISHANFKALMTPLGWQFDPIPWCCDGYWISLPLEATATGKLPEHITGLFYIQEASSMMPPTALFHGIQQPYSCVLDLAAAPGSKTTQIATLMANDGVLVANELSSSRVKALHSNLQRLGVTNTLISHFNGTVHGDYLENQFDAVLLDAPCSGEGTVRKDPDAFKNWSIEHVEQVSLLQKSLIKSAFMALKPGGQLVYSTCALNHLENQAVCHWLLETFEGNAQVVPLDDLFDGADKALTADGFLHIWPQIYNSEGFFVAKFTKNHATELSSQPKLRHTFPFTPVANKAKQPVIEFLQTYLTIDAKFSDHLYQRDREIWYFPQGTSPLTDRMRFSRHGVKLLDIKGKHQVINHDALTIWGTISLPLTREQTVDYLKGKDIPYPNPDKATGEILVGYQGQCIGLAKWVGNKIKNKLPRHLVRDHVQL